MSALLARVLQLAAGERAISGTQSRGGGLIVLYRQGKPLGSDERGGARTRRNECDQSLLSVGHQIDKSTNACAAVRTAGGGARLG